jgi:hypothetical protein
MVPLGPHYELTELIREGGAARAAGADAAAIDRLVSEAENLSASASSDCAKALRELRERVAALPRAK